MDKTRPPPLFPSNPVPPPEAPGCRNCGFLLTDDDGCYVVPPLDWFSRKVERAAEAELDMFALILRMHARRRLIVSILRGAVGSALVLYICLLLYLEHHHRLP